MRSPAAAYCIHVSQSHMCLLAGHPTQTLSAADGRPMHATHSLLLNSLASNAKPPSAARPAGYREAAEAARQQLVAIATDNGKDPEAFRRDLVNIAKTTLSSKILTQGGWAGGRAGGLGGWVLVQGEGADGFRRVGAG